MFPDQVIMVFQDPGSAYAILPSTIRPRRIQPGKRTILVSVLLSFMLLMSQLLRALQLDHPPKITNVHILQVGVVHILQVGLVHLIYIFIGEFFYFSFSEVLSVILIFFT